VAAFAGIGLPGDFKLRERLVGSLDVYRRLGATLTVAASHRPLLGQSRILLLLLPLGRAGGRGPGWPPPLGLHRPGKFAQGDYSPTRSTY